MISKYTFVRESISEIPMGESTSLDRLLAIRPDRRPRAVGAAASARTLPVSAGAMALGWLALLVLVLASSKVAGLEATAQPVRDLER
jgi:hypothetical protein